MLGPKGTGSVGHIDHHHLLLWVHPEERAVGTAAPR